jgi:hypothetical protein
LAYGIEQIIAILRYVLSVQDKNQLAADLCTPGTSAYEAYYSGYCTARYAVDAALQAKAEAGDAEAVKLLAERRKEAAISDSIKQKFGVAPGKTD